jgi:hypothetical protein
MPIHDHPNMSVFFRLVFGKLKYIGYDKVEDKYKYNDFADDEYHELLETKRTVLAKRTKLMNVEKDQLLYVRPSFNNMHTFVAEENSAFFDICLPNYTPIKHTRRITYFKEKETTEEARLRAGLTELTYDTTPPVMPLGFSVKDIPYKGYYA